VDAAPKSATIQAEYARLLWDHMVVQAQLATDDPGLQRVLVPLGQALTLDPQNTRARELLSEIEASVEGQVALPTPVPPSPTAVQATATAEPTPSKQPTSTPTAAPSTPTPTPVTATPTATPATGQGGGNNLPLIIGLAILPLAIAGLIYALSLGRRRS
jgi:hypothetical protein